jgi:single-strand DNA-binding protein
MVQLFGNITKDATVGTTKSGKTVINFTIALNDDYKNKEGKKVKRVTYIRCEYWIKNTDLGAYLTKGKQVEVWAHLYPTLYTNNQGEATANINGKVDRVQFHGTKTTYNPPKEENTQQATAATAATVEKADDLPF